MPLSSRICHAVPKVEEGQGRQAGPPFPVRTLLLNGSAAGTGENNLVALMEGDTLLAERKLPGRGASERFVPVVRQLLEEAGWNRLPAREKARQLGIIAVTGPGSFTGLRATLALAAGLRRGWQCAGIGVSLGEAIRATLDDRQATVLCHARRGRIFVDPPPGLMAVTGPYAVPISEVRPGQWQRVAGDAVEGSEALPELLERLGKEVEILPCSAPRASGLLKAARSSWAQRLSRAAEAQDERAFIPLYVDPPEARLPAAGLRLPPQ
ncbi:tRNA (adenosine(37)-N6)-threonylcarbamoyltransferase complex dimerization subunit type 1 TsaB [Oecophyllibacter saccharovorans]|nr:tRNA (adenosine(37)-N6)-threonylcarbamoyltransferase complex dimerization subunit type 1 TsaB [Oecophyllibacter saccharovorans]